MSSFIAPTSNNSNVQKPSSPININTAARRMRSASMSSGSSSSDGSASDVYTPASASFTSTQRPSGGVPSPGTSPILSYFLGTSPTKTAPPATFPFNRKFGPPPVFEEEEEVPVSAHARRATTAVADRFGHQPQTQPLPEARVERGTGLLRRLSLSSIAFSKVLQPHNEALPRSASPPSPPPNSAVSPTTGQSLPFARDAKPRRSATMSNSSKPRRAPSPMGERILKGHFDGFN